MAKWWQKIKHLVTHVNHWITVSVAIVLLGGLLFLLSFTNVSTQSYDVEKYELAKETILSPITVEDTEETNQKRSQASQSVQDIYTVSREITLERIDYIEEIFQAVTTVQEEQADSVEDEEGNKAREALNEQLSKEITNQIDVSLFEQLLTTNSEDLKIAEDVLRNGLSDVMGEGIKGVDVPEAKKELKNELDNYRFSSSLKEAIPRLVDFAVTENMFLDLDRTAEARTKAVNEVEPAMIQQGQVLVFEGERITNDVYDKLQLVGLLDNKSNNLPYLGLTLLIVLSMGILFYEIVVYLRQQPSYQGVIASIFIISLVMFLFMKVGSILQTSPVDKLYFAAPIAAGAMLLKLLTNERTAIVASVVYAVFGTVFFNGQLPGTLNVEAGIYLLFSQLSGIVFLMNLKDRMSIVKSGLGIAVVNVIAILMFYLFSYEPITFANAAINVSYGLLAALLSSVLTFGLLPFFEAGLGVLTDSKLLTLSSPTHPLLKKLLTETPGTYHHSVMVANLSEAACEAIGANGLLARVAAYYHDLGKTVHPHFFIENQVGIENPHNKMDPYESARIIIRHPYDGADMLRERKMPREIVHIAESHHGTGMLAYFYHKAREEDPEVEHSQFRYPGPKPKTKEAAVICICDSVEAAVRSMNHPSPSDIEELVQSIIQDRLTDGQLNDSPLTLKDVDLVKKTICQTLQGIFHSRIQYPKKQEAVKEAN
ncbi:HD family phosphohydrolase [Pontibacillus halophilus]|uniref:HD family phosphohydrolase n=1 Tax=Pontibacillus halophilus TaxID=516704 RepID=UPI001E3F10F2|nr:HDIG domain-containing metalloprotein [Pontibacillus halophilus]